jgi:hypothetical protein
LEGEPVLDWRQQPTGETSIMTQVGPHMCRLFRWKTQ